MYILFYQIIISFYWKLAEKGKATPRDRRLGSGLRELACLPAGRSGGTGALLRSRGTWPKLYAHVTYDAAGIVKSPVRIQS